MTVVYEPTEADREALRDPRGPVVDGRDALVDALQDEAYSHLIAVGDRVSTDLARSPLDPDICVVDGKIQRSAASDDATALLDDRHTLTAANPAGRITEGAWNTVRAAVARDCPTVVDVDGEEDLLALPAILFAPPTARIVHGHWEDGAVLLTPDDALKRFVRDLLDAAQYNRLIVGGTWDRFHAGHRYILLTAFEHGETVDIGVTTDDFARQHRARDAIDPYDTRRDRVAQFLDAFGLGDRATLMQIDDIYGNAVEEGDALLCTPDTLDNAKAVNERRLDDGRTPLDLAVIDRLTGQDGEPITATRIRDGAIDGNGRTL